jgi:hypothetical protein
MEHKFRAARAQAKFVTLLVKEGMDPGDYDVPTLKQEAGKTSRLSQPAVAVVAAVTIFTVTAATQASRRVAGSVLWKRVFD